MPNVRKPHWPYGRRITVTHPDNRSIGASCGFFTLTGVNASLRSGQLSADYLSFVLSGQDAGLHRDFILVAAQGSYTLTGQAATLTFAGGGAPATYTLTADYTLYNVYGDQGPSMPALNGSFALSGQAAGLNFLSTQVTTALFVLSGQAATLTYQPAAGNIIQDANGNNILDANSSPLQDAA